MGMFAQSGQMGFPAPAAPRRAGFTLVELLLVMFVLSVLVALVVGVGSYVIDKARMEETIAAQDRLLAGIAAYKKVTGKAPFDTTNTAVSIDNLVKELRGEGLAERMKEKVRKATAPFVGSGEGSFSNDAYGNAMKYYPTGGLGGKPLLLSSGPDGDFGLNDERKRRDNVRSDTRGDKQIQLPKK